MNTNISKTDWVVLPDEMKSLLQAVEDFTLNPTEANIDNLMSESVQWYIKHWPMCNCGSTVMPGHTCCSGCFAQSGPKSCER